MNEKPEITVLLKNLSVGDQAAMEQLIPLVYDELRHIARFHLKQPGDVTLNTKVLVHEAFLKLNQGAVQGVHSREQFLRVCSVVMRNLVVDFARKNQAEKRGGGEGALTFNDEIFEKENLAEDLLALDEALTKLEEYDPALARVVECRFFAGLTEGETAASLDISERTVRRYWVKAKTLLHQILKH